MQAVHRDIVLSSPRQVVSTATPSAPTRPRPRGRWVWRFSLLSLPLLILIWFLENRIGERHATTLFFTYIPQHWAFLPPILLGLAAMWRRHRGAIRLNIVAFLFVTLTFGGFNIPWRAWLPRAEASGPQLRVMSYNILLGKRGINEIAKVIKEENPDVFCLQEAKGHAYIDDPVPLLQQRFPGYHVAHEAETATFSRFPIVARQSHEMPHNERIVLETIIEVQGQRVTVLNWHPTTMRFSRSAREPDFRDRVRTSGQERADQFEVMWRAVREANQRREPLLVVGDFNTPPRGRHYRRLRSQFQDAFNVAGWGWGYTFSSDLPVIRIDYIWANPGIQVLRSWVPDVRASDHRPLVADLRLPAPKE